MSRFLKRSGRIVVLTLLMVISLTAKAQTISEVPAPEAYDLTGGWQQTSRWSLKTNGIGWLMLVSNIAVEWQIEDCFSIEVPVYFSAMNYFTSKIKFRTFTVQPELRYWFGCQDCDLRDRWFVGAHFGVGSWNYAVNGDWRYQDHLGKNPSVGGGLSVGYRMGLGQATGHWAMEFNLGVGVYSAYYDKFYIGNNGPYAEKGLRKTWWGIDRAAVSIVYTFGKGGDR